MDSTTKYFIHVRIHINILFLGLPDMDSSADPSSPKASTGQAGDARNGGLLHQLSDRGFGRFQLLPTFAPPIKHKKNNS